MTVKVSMGATIPVAQYGNLQPNFEVEGETLDAALDTAVEAMARLWNSVCDKPIRVRVTDGPAAVGVSTTVELTCWASGLVVPFDPIAHVYGDGSWLSGSTFAHQFTSEFNAEAAAGKMAAKVEPRHDGTPAVEPIDILDMWALNGEASSTFGSAVHAALELRGKFGWVSQLVKNGSNEAATSKNPTLKHIVESFYAGREDEPAVYEAFVADPVLKHCGQVDRLRIMPERNHIRVEDFKTNHDLTKYHTIRKPFKGLIENNQLGLYWLQLSFYARILTTHGFVVEGLTVHHWNGESWDQYDHDVIDISEGINQ
ncbi:exonuclease [Gordonia phage Dardanus]|uniref:Exonuclease n=1 Tax=Gordonia phage Dardanus TaxID=2588489 RepID=A0A514CX50_9CAUD|nr:exonuclease [Gordonia phage Dardanus]QDH85080.1 exonuclease [Gordonia phage Dardanus]